MDRRLPSLGQIGTAGSDGSPTVDCLPLSSSARTSGTELRVLGAEEVLARIPGDTASLHWVDQAG
jgi:hypothetical protein